MKSLADRFWVKVNAHDADNCWLWKGARSRDGYGSIQRGTRKQGSARAHRIAWELTFGPIPDGKFVAHKCDVPLCVRLAHLFLATNAENLADMSRKGRAGRRGRRLTNEQVIYIRTSNASLRNLAVAFGVSEHTIRAVRIGETWKEA